MQSRRGGLNVKDITRQRCDVQKHELDTARGSDRAPAPRRPHAAEGDSDTSPGPASQRACVQVLVPAGAAIGVLKPKRRGRALGVGTPERIGRRFEAGSGAKACISIPTTLLVSTHFASGVDAGRYQMHMLTCVIVPPPPRPHPHPAFAITCAPCSLVRDPRRRHDERRTTHDHALAYGTHEKRLPSHRRTVRHQGSPPAHGALGTRAALLAPARAQA